MGSRMWPAGRTPHLKQRVFLIFTRLARLRPMFVILFSVEGKAMYCCVKRSPASFDIRVVERPDAVAPVEAIAVPESHMLSEGGSIHMAGVRDYKDLVRLLRSGCCHFVPLNQGRAPICARPLLGCRSRRCDSPG